MAAPKRPMGPLEVFRLSPAAASRALVIVGPFTILFGLVIAFGVVYLIPTSAPRRWEFLGGSIALVAMGILGTVGGFLTMKRRAKTR